MSLVENDTAPVCACVCVFACGSIYVVIFECLNAAILCTLVYSNTQKFVHNYIYHLCMFVLNSWKIIR